MGVCWESTPRAAVSKAAASSGWCRNLGPRDDFRGPQRSRKAVLADSTSAAVSAASLPSSDDLQRAEDFTREPFLHEGETLEEALAPGTARRRALDAALT